jgi:hypothetical protein
MSIFKIAAAALVAFSTASSAPAFAADVLGASTSDCTCLAAPVAGGALGSASAAGDVRASSGAKFVKVGSSVTLSDGTQIAVGGNGQASISAGSSCNLTLGAYDFATVTNTPGGVCVKVSTIDPAAFAALAGGAISPLLLAGGGALVIGGGIYLIGQGSEPLSQ